jgi:nucleosome binding factor SPN SPT16 subunit
MGLGFYGVAIRSTCYIMLITNCLVDLAGPPFTVTTLHEIEVASFESFGFKPE